MSVYELLVILVFLCSYMEIGGTTVVTRSSDFHAGEKKVEEWGLSPHLNLNLMLDLMHCSLLLLPLRLF